MFDKQNPHMYLQVGIRVYERNGSTYLIKSVNSGRCATIKLGRWRHAAQAGCWISELELNFL